MAWVPPGVEVARPSTGRWPAARSHVGDPVAVVIAEDKYAVVDAAEDVVVDYDPLPVVIDPEAALEDGAPIIHEEFGTNESHQWSLGGGDLEAGVRGGRRRSSSGASSTTARRARAIEPRAMVAECARATLTL